MTALSPDERLDVLYDGRARERARLLRDHKEWALPSVGDRLRSLVERDAGEFLRDLVRRERMTRTLEVGLANGGSALFICQALAEAGGGRHTAIDPYQHEEYGGRGLDNVERTGLGRYLRWIEAPSHEALPRLVAEEGRGAYDLVFIDGKHTFDFALVDFFYADLLVRPGGYVAFDDLWMPAVLRAVNFVLRNRDYVIHPVPDEAAPLRRVGRFVRRAAVAPTVAPRLLAYPLNVGVLRKRSDRPQESNEFVPF